MPTTAGKRGGCSSTTCRTSQPRSLLPRTPARGLSPRLTLPFPLTPSLAMLTPRWLEGTVPTPLSARTFSSALFPVIILTLVYLMTLTLPVILITFSMLLLIALISRLVRQWVLRALPVGINPPFMVRIVGLNTWEGRRPEGRWIKS